MDMVLYPLPRSVAAGAPDAAPGGQFHRIGPQGQGAGKARASRFLTLFALAVFVLAGCEKTPPEEKLRATIAQMQADGEAHEVGAVMDSVAEDFGGPGGMDRKQLQAFLALTSLRNKELGVTLGPIEVELMGERATAK